MRHQRERKGGRPAKLDASARARLASMYHDGVPVPELAHRFGLTRASVYRYIHRASEAGRRREGVA